MSLTVSLPNEIMLNIMYLVDGSTFMALSNISKNINTLARAYFVTELKDFYIKLIDLQHHYCVKFHRSSWVLKNTGRENEGLKNDRSINTNITNLTLSAEIIKKDDNKDILEIIPNLEKEMIPNLEIISNLEIIPNLEIVPVPKDMILRPCFQAPFWNLGDRFDMIVVPIDHLQVEFENPSKCTQQQKKQLLQCVEMANLRYKHLSQPENQLKLANTINVNLVRIMGRNGNQHDVDLTQVSYTE